MPTDFWSNKMALSKNINSYNDIRRVLETVLARGGSARYRTETKAQATRWRLRAYMYRKLLQQQALEAAGDLPGYTPTTPYDDMILRLDDTDVLIAFDGQAIPGELLDESGAKLPLVDNKPHIDEDDPLLLEAMKLADE